ncbi:hypothetical protein ACFQX4_15555 [Roseomonas sp. GCM10028921]
MGTNTSFRPEIRNISFQKARLMFSIAVRITRTGALANVHPQHPQGFHGQACARRFGHSSCCPQQGARCPHEQRKALDAAVKGEKFTAMRGKGDKATEKKFRPWYFKQGSVFLTAVRYGVSHSSLPTSVIEMSRVTTCPTETRATTT